MEGIDVQGDAVVVSGSERTLIYRPRLVALSDGLVLEHETRGGTLSSVWAGDLGERYVEIVHLGAGPEGGELVLVVPDADVVVLGDLAGGDVTDTTGSVVAYWAATIDLVIGLARPDSTILTSSGAITRDELEDFHQRLLGVLHG